MLAALFASIALIIFGMAPTLVSFFVERRPGNSGSTCVLLFNLAGIIPVLGLIWDGPPNGGAGAMGDVFNWLVVYAAAAVGFVVAWGSPYISATWTQIFAGSRLKAIKSRQKELYDEWGTSVVE